MRLIILLTTLAFSVLFMFYSPSGKVGFLFSDVVLSADTWVYFLMEHLILVLLAVIIVELEPRYRIATGSFLGIQVVDTVDYLLTYGEPWFPFVSWNILKTIIFIFIILYDKWKPQE